MQIVWDKGIKSFVKNRGCTPVRLIQQLDDKDKHVIFKMIDTMLTKKKFKDFFQKKRCITLKS